MRLPPPPPLRGFFGSPEERSAAFKYWVSDTAVGGLKLGLYRLFRHVPIDWCSDFGAFVSRFTRHSYPASEARARRLWAYLHPDKADKATVDAAIDRLWRNVSRTMAEFPLLNRLWEAGRIKVESAHHVDRAREAGRPVLIAALHLGNWEAAGRAIVALWPGASGVYLAPDNRFEHRIAVESRTGYGGRLIQAGPNTIRDAIKELKAQHGPFTIWIDEEYKNRVHAPAFGRRLATEGNITFAIRLASMTDAVFVPVYCVRDGDRARFIVTFLPPVELAQTGDRDADLAENVRRVDAVIAPVVARHLDQWFFGLDFEFDADTAPNAASR